MDHVYYKCPPGCTNLSCMFCVGGLGGCTVCKAFEGTLPTECPGTPISEEDQQLIYKASLDYRAGKWIQRPLKKWEDPLDREKRHQVLQAVLRLNPA